MNEFSKAYENYPNLYETGKKAIGEMGRAMWHFAQLKEITWYQWGLQGITAAVHGLEHVYGEYIDRFKEAIATLGLPLIYPDIKALDEDFTDIVSILDTCIDLIDDVNNALSDFIFETDNARLEPLARQAEEIQIMNFRPRAWLTQTRTMAENGESMASLDKWFEEFMAKEGDALAAD